MLDLANGRLHSFRHLGALAGDRPASGDLSLKGPWNG